MIAGLTHEKVNFRLRSGKKELTSPFLEALYHHGLWNILVIYRRYDDRIEGFYFVASREDECVISSYVEKRDTFEKIVTSMELPLSQIISEQRWDNQRVQFRVPKLIRPQKTLEEIKYQLQVKEANRRNINFQYMGNKIVVSQMMINYLKCLAQGYSIKTICQTLNISKGTIGNYLSYFKESYRLNSKIELIKFINTIDQNEHLKDCI